MTEIWVGTIPLIGLLIMSMGCWFYMWGGRHDKWKRRFIGSLICSTAVWVEAYLLNVFQPLMLLIYPLTIIAFHLGYSPTLPIKKQVIKRLIIVICSLSVGVLLSCILGGKAWDVLPIQFLIGLCSIWLGVKGIIPAAPEEFFVCLTLNVCNLMYPLVKGAL